MGSQKEEASRPEASLHNSQSSDRKVVSDPNAGTPPDCKGIGLLRGEAGQLEASDHVLDDHSTFWIR